MENDPKINFAESIRKAGEKRLAISYLSISLRYFNSFSTKNSATYFQVHGKAHFSVLTYFLGKRENKRKQKLKTRKENKTKTTQTTKKPERSGHVTISSSTNRFCCNFYIRGRLSQWQKSIDPGSYQTPVCNNFLVTFHTCVSNSSILISVMITIHNRQLRLSNSSLSLCL